MSNKIVTSINCKVGDKVIRGRDWQWDNQDGNSLYGRIKKIETIKWVMVEWINYKGMIVSTYSYRAGLGKHDLYFYE